LWKSKNAKFLFFSFFQKTYFSHPNLIFFFLDPKTLPSLFSFHSFLFFVYFCASVYVVPFSYIYLCASVFIAPFCLLFCSTPIFVVSLSSIYICASVLWFLFLNFFLFLYVSFSRESLKLDPTFSYAKKKRK
jgi:hypothetical protein